MKKSIPLLSLYILLTSIISAQQLVVSGPMLGNIDLRSAVIWVELSEAVQAVTVTYTPENDIKYSKKKIITVIPKIVDHHTSKIELSNLEINTKYNYTLSATVGKTIESITGKFKTKDLWQWRKAPPTFSFLAGSCAYFNEPMYDRPGKPYGQDSSIFEVMAKESAEFMVWLGDNWYTREVDYNTPSGLLYRASLTRKQPVLKNFLKAMPQYAIWDDHDYGPDNSDKSYVLKKDSRNIFRQFWCNPSYGENDEGIYTKLNWHDVDIFLLDDRWFRSNDALPDSINDMPNSEKKMLGIQQIEWFRNAIAGSQSDPNINFRIIALGSQVLNPLSTVDCLRHYPAEYAELMKILGDLKIEGVIFLTGDRHLSEIIKQDRQNAYPLYDITTSPLTAGPNKWHGNQVNNPFRIDGIDGIQSYARFNISGPAADRWLKVEFLDKTGQIKTSWQISKADLSYKKK